MILSYVDIITNNYFLFTTLHADVTADYRSMTDGPIQEPIFVGHIKDMHHYTPPVASPCVSSHSPPPRTEICDTSSNNDPDAIC